MGNSWPKWRRRAKHIQERLNSGATIEELANEYDIAPKSMRNRIGELKDDGLLNGSLTETLTDADEVEAEILKFGVEREIDGKTLTHKSTRLLVLSETDDKDPIALMNAHKYDPDEWELLGSKSKIWNTYSKQDGVVTLFSSSITVKPLTSGWTFAQLLDVIRSDVQPVHIDAEPAHMTDKRMLEIPIMDAHFGNATYDHYKDSQRTIYDLLSLKRWEETLFVVGSDLFHADNFKSTTVSGTQLETVNMPRAWNDCAMFYDVLIETALRQSGVVKLVYIPGNHDSSFGWSFVQYLKAKYPQAAVDDRVKERKVEVYGKNFIALSHGEKSRRDLIRIIPAEFPLEWAQTTNREAHIGHLHREEETRAKDEFGLTVRTMSTANPLDQYHEDNGFVTAHKRFQLFEYSEDSLKHIHYV